MPGPPELSAPWTVWSVRTWGPGAPSAPFSVLVSAVQLLGARQGALLQLSSH